MNPIDAVFEWLQAMPEYAGFEPVRGVWVDQSDDPPTRFATLMHMPGGQGFDSLMNHGQMRLLLLGMQREPPTVVEGLALAIQARLQVDYKACGIAQIALIGGIIGPGQTQERRPWFELNLSIIS